MLGARSIACTAALILGCSFVTGCQAERPSAKPRVWSEVSLRETCEQNLHQLAGYLMEFHLVRHHLPERLDELTPLAAGDESLKLACPASARPYVYVPAGMYSPNSDRALILYDAEPAHGGLRCAIVASRPQGNRPASFWVVELDQSTFAAYQIGVAPTAP